MVQKKMVPPDGGWGWVVMVAYALNSIVFIPIMQCFGLIFKDTFILMGFSATDGSIIINTNAAVSMLTGLINGPLLNTYGYRKISFASVTMTITGLLLTSFANSFTTLLVTYGLITSIGMGMGMSSYPLALNTYFTKNRGKATGFAMTITGLGPIIMPQLISFLLQVYGVQGAVIVLAGLSSHSFISAMLLQPVKWHMKEEILEETEDEKDEKEGKTGVEECNGNLLKSEHGQSSNNILINRKPSIVNSTLSMDHDAEVKSIYGFDTPLAGSVLSLSGPRQRKISVSSFKSAQEKPKKLHEKFSSCLSIDDKEFKQQSESDGQELLQNNMEIVNGVEKVYNPEMCLKKDAEERVSENVFKRILRYIVNMFDLTLLNDRTYINIMLGMSLAVFAELNFSLLTPFILADLNLSTPQIATFLSVLSIADICFRFLAPFIGDFLNKPPRMMYLFTLILLIITRYSILLVDGYTSLLYVAIALGIAKGVRTVYMSLVIPSYVPIHRLATASGLQMVVNGLFIFIGGPVLGLIRDITGSYTNCIYIINLVTFTTIVMWTVEVTYKRCRRGRKKANIDLDT